LESADWLRFVRLPLRAVVPLSIHLSQTQQAKRNQGRKKMLGIAACLVVGVWLCAPKPDLYLAPGTKAAREGLAGPSPLCFPIAPRKQDNFAVPSLLHPRVGGALLGLSPCRGSSVTTRELMDPHCSSGLAPGASDSYAQSDIHPPPQCLGPRGPMQSHT
jgi:hypothetical protein